MMPSQPAVLFLYTIDFPYGDTEPYLFNELPYLSGRFSRVVIVAEVKREREVALPVNVEVFFLKELQTPQSKRVLLLKNALLMCRILVGEFVQAKARSFFLKRWKLTVSELIQALLISEKIRMLQSRESLPVMHYSFWMNAFPLALAILRRKGLIAHYVFRVHGFDLYQERWPMGFIPYRSTNYRYASAVFPVSDMGLRYIQTHFSDSRRAQRAYLGTAEHGNNPLDPSAFVLVTCSSIIPLKRLGLLIEALQQTAFPLSWYHFGSGKEDYVTTLRQQAEQLPAHVQVHWMGQVSQAQLFEFYRRQAVSVFLNVSETEGLPVSLMEATSFGIPLMATDVGGTSEIVNSHTGVLLARDVTPAALAEAIAAYRSSEWMSAEKRRAVKAFWESHFSAAHNYQRFCDTLLGFLNTTRA